MCNFLYENENVENGKTRVYMTAIFEFWILHTVLTWELNQLIKITAAIKPVEANKENHQCTKSTPTANYILLYNRHILIIIKMIYA